MQFNVAIGPVVILSPFFKRFNYAGACTGIITGAVVDIARLLMFTDTIMPAAVTNLGVYEILPGFIANAVVAVVVSLVTKAPSQEVEGIYAKATDASVDD